MNGKRIITSPQAVADILPELPEVKRTEERNELANIYAELAEKYPNMRPYKIRELADVIYANTFCAACNGVYCEKPNDEYIVASYHITGDDVEFRYGACPVKKKQAQKARRARNQAYSQIPIRFRNKTAKDYERHEGNAKAIDAAKSLFERNTGLYVFGAPGVGKSFLASIIASQALAAEKSVFFADVPTILSAIKISWKDPNNPAATTVERIVEADLAILDDLGAERATDWAGEQIFRILNARYNNATPTVITSNFDLKALHEQLGGSYIAGRIVRRIYDNMTVVRMSEAPKGNNVIPLF